MGEFNSSFRSMTWEEDGVYAAASGAYQTATNYSGRGMLAQVGCYCSNGADLLNIEITIDGGTLHEWDTNGVNGQCVASFAGGASSMVLNLNTEFQVSCLVRMQDSAAGNIAGQTQYNIGSKEIKRELFAPNAALPGRDETYDFPVMVVYFTGKYGDSNKIQFPGVYPIPERVKKTVDKDGYVIGQLQRIQLNPTLGQSRYLYPAKAESKPVSIEIDGITYHVETDHDGKINGRDFSELPVCTMEKRMFNEARQQIFNKTLWVKERHQQRLETATDDPKWVDWLNYWEALRNMPAQPGFDPLAPKWPAPPETI